MNNIKAISAFLTTKLSSELTIIATSNALKQWQHGDNTPIVDTFQALTGQTYIKRLATETVPDYRASLINTLKSAGGTDAVKSRLHALGETLEALTVECDYLSIAQNVPALIKMHLDLCKTDRAAIKATKQSEALTLAPDSVISATVAPATVSIDSIISAIQSDMFTPEQLAQLSKAIKSYKLPALI